MKMNKRVFLLATLALTAAASVPARAQEATIRLALIAQVGQPIEQGARRFKELVEQKTTGRVKVEIFPGGQLGGEIQLQDSVANGTIQAASIGTPVTAGKLKKLDVLNMYYLWRDRAHMSSVLTGDVGSALFDEYEKKTGIEVLAANWQQGTRQTMTKKRFTKPEEAKGVKIRTTAGVPLYDQLWSAMGANPVPLPFPEAYSAMQTGVVDAVELPLDFIVNNGFNKLGKYLVQTDHYMYTNLFIVNSKFLGTLPPDTQRILREAAKAAGEFQTQLVLKNEGELLNKIKAAGVEIVPTNRRAFATSVKPVFDKNGDVWGADLLSKINGTGS